MISMFPRLLVVWASVPVSFVSVKCLRQTDVVFLDAKDQRVEVESLDG